MSAALTEEPTTDAGEEHLGCPLGGMRDDLVRARRAIADAIEAIDNVRAASSGQTLDASGALVDSMVAYSEVLDSMDIAAWPSAIRRLYTKQYMDR